MTNVNELPEINRRLWQLVSDEAGGNSASFAEQLGLPQHRIRRLFRPDTRNGKYVEPSIEVVSEIARVYKVYLKWIIYGTGEKYENSTPAPKKVMSSSSEKETEILKLVNNFMNTINKKDELIELIQRRIDKLTDELREKD